MLNTRKNSIIALPLTRHVETTLTHKKVKVLLQRSNIKYKYAYLKPFSDEMK